MAGGQLVFGLTALREAMAGRGDWTSETIKRSDTAQRFMLLPHRWVVERIFAWPD